MAKKDKRISGGLAGLAGFNLATGEQDAEAVRKREEEDRRKAQEEERQRLDSANRAAARKGSGQGNRGAKYNDGYVGAPYNFVPMWEDVAKPEKRISHDSKDKSLISGEISYKVTARTPIFISDGVKGNEQFVRDHYGRYYIPGSSMCGLIRSNVQVLSQSSLADDIDDYELMYREVGGAKGFSMNKERYEDILGAGTIMQHGSSVSILKNVSAGYICKNGGNYVIYGSKVKPGELGLEKMNYYVLSERHIFNSLNSDDKIVRDRFEYLRSLPETAMQHTLSGYEFQKYTDENNHVHYVCRPKGDTAVTELKKDIAAYMEARDANKREHSPQSKSRFEEAKRKLKASKKKAKDELNEFFVPGTYRISYETESGRIRSIGDEKKFKDKGYLLVSGKMQEKKVMYVIPEMDSEDVVCELDKESDEIRSFEVDYNKRFSDKDKKGGIGRFFGLPKEGETKPVFYITDTGKVYFGFTPHLRLFYDYTIHDGLGSGHAAGLFDYTKSLFGYSSKDDSYKSRLSFSDAVVQGEATVEGETDKILGEPKPTSYADYLDTYLDGDGELRPHTYNDQGFRIRGMKEYWLHDRAEMASVDSDKQNVITRLRPLSEGTRFKGKVRFHNLRKEELGLLLWSLTLSPDSEMNIGKGKAFGLGRIKLEVEEVKAFDIETAYASASLSLNPYKDIDSSERDAMINAFRSELAGRLGVNDVMKLPAIEGFFKMKDSKRMPDEKEIRYMNIDNSEYQKRRPLQDIESVLSGNTGNPLA